MSSEHFSSSEKEKEQEKEKKRRLWNTGDDNPDTEAGHVAVEVNVLLDKNGFKLFPTPVQNDGLDPLNWSSFQKHVILSIVMAL